MVKYLGDFNKLSQDFLPAIRISVTVLKTHYVEYSEPKSTNFTSTKGPFKHDLTKFVCSTKILSELRRSQLNATITWFQIQHK